LFLLLLRSSLLAAGLLELADCLTDGTLGVVVRIVLLTDSIARNLFRDAPLGFAASQSAFRVCPIALGLRGQVEPGALSVGWTGSKGLFVDRFVDGQLRKVVRASN
jgi:hypothetical protein